MKKLFTMFFVLLIGVASAFAADTWTVAGTAVNGDSWDQTNTANDMTNDSGTTWQLTITGKTLEAGTSYQYKVVKNHSWNEAYPSSNKEFTVSETGVYTIVYTFDSNTKAVSQTTTKTANAGEVEHTYSVVGSSTALLGSEWTPADTNNDMEKQSDGTYKKTYTGVTLEAGNIEYKVAQDHAWSVAYPSSNATLNISANGIYTVTFTFNPTSKAVGATATLIAALEDVVYLEYTEDSWTTTQEAQLEKQTDGTYKLADKALAAGVEFQIKINDTWYGSNTDATETISSDNCTNIGFKSGGYANNFTIATAGTWTFVVNVEQKQLTVTGEWPVAETTKVYIIGNATEWNPSVGQELNTTDDVNFTGELVANDSGDGYSYFGFTTKLGASSSDWDGIAAYRFGPEADGENYWITDETINIDIPYVNSGYKSIRVPAGVTYTISVNTEAKTFKVAGTLPVAEVTDLYLIGEFNEWNSETKVALTKQADNTFTIEKEFEGAFKFIDNLGNWYGAAESADLTLTETTSTDVTLTTAGGAPNFILPNSTWTLTVAADQSTFSVAGTWPVVVVEPELYLMSNLSKDSEDNWVTSDDYKFEKNADGIYHLDNVSIPAATDFKIYDKNNDTWYGGEAEEDSYHWITAENNSNINLVDGKNFYFDVAGTWTFSIDMEAKTMSVAGEWPVAEPVVSIVGGFNEWDTTADVLTKNADGKYIITKTFDEAQTFQFVIDGAYLGGNVDNGSEAITESNSTDVAYQAGTFNNFSIAAGTWTFTLDPGTQTFTVTGEWAAPATDLYLKGDFTEPSWGDGGVQLTDNGDGTFTLADYTFENNAQFQVVDVTTNTWYGHNGEAEINADNHENVVIATGYENNFSIAAGTYTFVVDFNNKTMTVSGDFSNPNTGKTLQLRGTFNDWATDKAFTDNGNGTYSVDVTLAKGDEFKVVDATDGDVWYGFNTGDGSLYWLNGSAHSDIQLTTGDGSENFYVAVGGQWTLTVDYATMKLSGTRVIEKYGVLGDEAIFGSNWANDLVLEATAEGIYEATLKNLDIAAGTYDYKARADEDWGWYDMPMSGNNQLEVTASGLYDVKFTLNTNVHSLEATLTPVTTITLTISEAEYATVYYENVAFQIPADVKASTYKVQDEKLVESKTVTKNPAGQALVLYKAGGGDIVLTVINSDEAEAADADNLLVGTIWDEDEIVEDGYTFFYLCRKNGTGDVGFYFFNTDGTSVENIGHKAYLRVANADVPAGVMGFSLDNATTGINGITAEEALANGAVYTLNGVRLQNTKNLPKGIYVMNGRKFVVK